MAVGERRLSVDRRPPIVARSLSSTAFGLVDALAAAFAIGLALLSAFLGGGVVLNVIKEELPSKRHSRFRTFAVGATAYTLLLLAV